MIRAYAGNMGKNFDTKSFKDAVCEQTDALLEQFRNGDLSGRALTQQLSGLVDRNVVQIAEHFLKDHSDDVALVFTGGNGREEVCPGSDLDVLLLVPDRMSQDLVPALEEDLSGFVTALWNVGYEPGIAIRTVDQCVESSLDEISQVQKTTIWSSLLECRLVWGQDDLFEQVGTKMDHLNEEQWEPYLDG